MRLRDVLLCQPDFALENPVTTLSWLKPPFAAPTTPNVSDTPLDQRTPGEVSYLLKPSFRPALLTGKKPKEMRWVTTCLTSEPTKETTPRYSDLEASASLYVAVDTLTRNDGIRYSGFEDHTSATARGLMVLIACILQQFLRNPPPDHTMDMDTLANFTDSFSFSKIRQRTLQSRFCVVLCDTINDQVTLLDCGGIVLPVGQMSLFVTFAPSMNGTLRTSLPKEIRLVLRSHKALFYQGGLVINVASSIPLTPVVLFQLALLTVLCLHQGDTVIADVTPQATHLGSVGCFCRLRMTPQTVSTRYRG
jgi:hypothetical protein